MKRIAIIIGLACITSGAISQTRYKTISNLSDTTLQKSVSAVVKRDTTREVIVIYVKVPGWIHTINGYTIQENGRCIAHYKDNWKLIKLPLRVWDCETHRDYGHKRRE